VTLSANVFTSRPDERSTMVGLAQLPGARLACCSEASSHTTLRTEIVKRVSSGGHDTAKLWRMYVGEIPFKPLCIPVFAVNEMPRLDRTDPAVLARLVSVPCEAHFARPGDDVREDGHVADPKILDMLRPEMPAVLHRALERVREQRPFLAPQVYREPEHLAEAIEIDDSLADFLAACCEPVPPAKLRRDEPSPWFVVQELYDSYRTSLRWVESNRIKLASFSRRLTMLGYRKPTPQHRLLGGHTADERGRIWLDGRQVVIRIGTRRAARSPDCQPGQVSRVG
jgi:phage/plasmid-associated DNA primase